MDDGRKEGQGWMDGWMDGLDTWSKVRQTDGEGWMRWMDGMDGWWGGWGAIDGWGGMDDGWGAIDGWDGMEWDVMGWDEMGWYGMDGWWWMRIDGWTVVRWIFNIWQPYNNINISIARNAHEIELAVPEQPTPLNLMETFMKLPDSGSRRSLGWSSKHSCSAGTGTLAVPIIVPVLTLLQCQSQHSYSVEVLTLLQCQHSCSVEVVTLLQCPGHVT